MGLKKEIREYLKGIHTVHRYRHILGVRKTASELANIHYDKSVGKSKKDFIYDTEIAALLHDISKGKDPEELFKDIKKDKDLSNKDIMKFKDFKVVYHAFGGAYAAMCLFGIKDQDILNSIRYHTTGRSSMSLMEKIIYLADYIEPGRDIDGLEAIRKTALKDLDKACLMAHNKVISYLKGKSSICPLAFEFGKDLKKSIKKNKD